MRIRAKHLMTRGLPAAVHLATHGRPYPVQGDEIPTKEEPTPVVPDEELEDAVHLAPKMQDDWIQFYMDLANMCEAYNRDVIKIVETNYMHQINMLPFIAGGYSMSAEVKKD